MKIRFCIILLLQLIFLFPVDGQEREIDSLKNLVKTGNDSAKFYALAWLGFKEKKQEDRYNYRMQALQFAEKIGNKKFQFKANKYLGFMNETMGAYDKAIEYYKQMEQLARKMDDAKLLSITFQHRGDILLNLKEHESALKWYRKRLNVARTIDQKSMGDAFNSLGTAFKELGQLDSAIHYHQLALKNRKATGQELRESFSLNNLGLVYKKKGDYDEAIRFLKQSLEIKTRIQDIEGMASSNINIGNTLNIQGRYKEALGYLERGIVFADSAENDIFLINGYEGAVSAYLENDNSKVAKYFDNLISLRDSRYDQSAVAQARDLEAKYHIEEKEKLFAIQKEKDALEKAALDQKNQSLKLQMYLALGVMVAVLALVFFVIRASLQRKKSNTILATQKAEIEQKNKDITDSINYARNIQEAMLPLEREMTDGLDEHFVYYKPKDIVSGDFYWISKRKSYTIIAVGDCTGHGVPGGFMSMLGHNVLNQVVNDDETTSPAQALTAINQKVLNTYRKDDDRQQIDGMDIAMCAINRSKMELTFSGALRPLWLIRGSEVIAHKGTKTAIGSANGDAFKDISMKLEKNDIIYLFSDGFPDQFGGELGKKLKSSGFRNLLLSISNLKLKDQKVKIDAFLKNWMGENEQLDDICIVGFRI